MSGSRINAEVVMHLTCAGRPARSYCPAGAVGHLKQIGFAGLIRLCMLRRQTGAHGNVLVMVDNWTILTVTGHRQYVRGHHH